MLREAKGTYIGNMNMMTLILNSFQMENLLLTGLKLKFAKFPKIHRQISFI